MTSGGRRAASPSIASRADAGTRLARLPPRAVVALLGLRARVSCHRRRRVAGAAGGPPGESQLTA